MFTMISTIGNHTDVRQIDLDTLEDVTVTLLDAGYIRQVHSVLLYDFNFGDNIQVRIIKTGPSGELLEMPSLRCYTCNNLARPSIPLHRVMARNAEHYICDACLPSREDKYPVIKGAAITSRLMPDES